MVDIVATIDPDESGVSIKILSPVDKIIFSVSMTYVSFDAILKVL